MMQEISQTLTAGRTTRTHGTEEATRWLLLSLCFPLLLPTALSLSSASFSLQASLLCLLISTWVLDQGYSPKNGSLIIESLSVIACTGSM